MKNIFKTYAVVLLLTAPTSTNTFAQSSLERSEPLQSKVSIEFNKNIEFLGYAIQIGEAADDLSEAAKKHPLTILFDEKRSRFSNNPSLLRVFELGANMSYSFFVELFAKMDELPHSNKYNIPEDFMEHHNLNSQEGYAVMDEIMEEVNKFYKTSEFDSIWNSSQSWYKKALKEIKSIIPDKKVLETMESFYDQQYSQYKIIPSLTFWSGPGFGFHEEKNKSAIAYFVLGPLSDDYHFLLNDQFETKFIHEFGHSFVNHVLKANCSDLIEDTKTLFDPVANKMSPQGYPEWSTCIYEHFVRAGEVLVPEKMGNKKLGESNLQWNVENKSFIYLPFLVEKLRDYRISQGLTYKQSVINTMKDFKEKYMP